ncbi:PTS system, fructose-specific IIA component / PTS system, fructose-specific IIB component /PTS system, fructose-specific IIC component [Streptococcus agalactiae]|nr:PTS system, fructose-specific IIA component / PTS system, fructose-specific IIB component /PTS system, fructose-specific IIC component [Streptococcus agalactiae]
MKIQDLLKKEVMIMDLKATSKEAAIDEMITKLVDTGVVTNFAIFKDGIMKREAQTSTGLGDGIAMPHSKNAAVKEATVLLQNLHQVLITKHLMDSQLIYSL